MSDRLLARRTAAWMVASLCLATFLALGPASGIALAWQDAPKTDPSAAAGGSAPAPGGGGDAAVDPAAGAAGGGGAWPQQRPSRSWRAPTAASGVGRETGAAPGWQPSMEQLLRGCPMPGPRPAHRCIPQCLSFLVRSGASGAGR